MQTSRRLARLVSDCIAASAPARAFARLARRFSRDQKGGILILTALAATALVGFAGLAVDIGRWQLARRDQQGVADQAAYSAAVAVGAGKSATTEARAVAASHGIVHGVGGAAVAVNLPPTLGHYAGQSGAVEVIVQRTQTIMLSSLLHSSAPTVKARAVATTSSSGACVMALDPTASKSIKVTGGAVVNSGECNLYNNSSSSDGTDLAGGSSLTTKNAYLVGNYGVSGGSTFNVSGALQTGATATADPYASRTMPSYSGCAQTNFTASGTVSMSPGVYCGGIKVFGTANLQPGVYIIDGGDLSVVSGGKINGTGGVTFILTHHTGSNYGDVSITGGGTVNVTAMSSGATAGIAFWIDGAAQGGQTDNFTAGSNQSITGVIYAPQRTVSYAGTSTSTSPCLQIVAKKIEFTGNSTFKHDCAGVGLSDPTVTVAKLVE